MPAPPHDPTVLPEISFILPAHNEAQALPGTLLALGKAADSLQWNYEIIVSADACTDRTIAIATSLGARVIEVNHRQIAATRNAGARDARGKILFFVDADTQVHAVALKDARQVLEEGAIGGGALVRMDESTPRWFRHCEIFWNCIARIFNTAGGCFIFCRKEAFEKIEGFPETHYAAEELFFIRRLKSVGRFVVLREKITTSGRKARTHSPMELLKLVMLAVGGGRGALRKREGLEYFYNRRSDPNLPPA